MYLLTFSFLTRDKQFVHLMRTALSRLEKAYGLPVDVEFTVEIIPGYPYPEYKLHILQCRPLSQRKNAAAGDDAQGTSARGHLYSPRMIWCRTAARRAFATSSLSIPKPIARAKRP